MRNKVELFGVGEAEKSEEVRQSRALYGFTAILAALLLAYGSYRLVIGDGVRMGVIDLVFGTVLIANALAYRWHRRIEWAKPMLTIFVGIVNIIILLSGGIGNTAIYWAFAFPAATYLFQGLYKGTVLNAAYLTAFVGIAVAQSYGKIDTHYTPSQFKQAFVVLLIITALGYVTERGQKRFRLEVIAGREQLRALLANLPTGVIMVDAKLGKPVAANASVEQLLGRSIDPHIAVPDFPAAYSLTNEDGTALASGDFPLQNALTGGESNLRSKVLVRRPEGGNLVLRTAATAIHDVDGKVSGAVAVFDDVTREHEVDVMKSEFASFANHQLKNPLTSIRWSLDALLGGDSGKLLPEQESQIRQIGTVVEQLSRLVSDLLSVSRLESLGESVVLRERSDLRPILSAAVRDLAVMAKKLSVHLEEKDLPERIVRRADGIKMREVFANVIGNAVKYSRQGGIVTVGFSHDTPNGDAIYVKDEGVGIPHRSQGRVFERFFRAENVKDIEGTGLGLYIAKEIVGRHGGQIWFDSTEGEGSTFYISIPEIKGA